jgi:hypothetical protein
MPVTLDQQAKKGLVKHLQSRINRHIESEHPDRVTIAQVGEWLAEGLGFDDQNDLALQLKPLSHGLEDKNPEQRLYDFANFAARGLISEIEDSALEKQEGWTVLLLKYAHLCVSLYWVDNPIGKHMASQPPEGSVKLAQTFFAGYLAGPFNAQSNDPVEQQYWPVWNPNERRELLFMLSDYSETVLSHKHCPSLVTCVADHSQAIAIAYGRLLNRMRTAQVESPFSSAIVLRQVAEEIDTVGQKMALSVSPRRDLLMAMLVAMKVVKHDLDGFFATGRSEQADLKKCRG